MPRRKSESMRSLLVSIAFLLIPGAVGLPGASFWDKKDFTEWSDSQVRKMLAKSPWAAEVLVTLNFQSQDRSDPGPRAGGARYDSPRHLDERLRRGEDVDPEMDLSAPVAKLTVRWQSALPIRQALVRARVAEKTDPRNDPKAVESPLNEDTQRFLARQETHYLVVIERLPPGIALAPEHIKRALLRREGKDQIVAEALAIQQRKSFQESGRVSIRFPRTDKITLEDKVVEVLGR